MGKKILTVLLAILLVFSSNIVVNAASLSTDGATTQVPVKYTANTTAFVINIPAQLSPETTHTSFTITSSSMNLRPDEELVVRISSGCNSLGQVILQREGDKTSNPATLTTTLVCSGKNIVRNDYIVGAFRDSDTSTNNIMGSVTMSALKVDESTKSGDYSAVVEFQLELRKVSDE